MSRKEHAQKFAKDVFSFYNVWQQENGELTKKEIIAVLSSWKDVEEGK